MSFDIWGENRIRAILTYGQALRIRKALDNDYCCEECEETKGIAGDLISDLDLVLAAVYGKLRQMGFEAEYPPSREDKS